MRSNSRKCASRGRNSSPARGQPRVVTWSSSRWRAGGAGAQVLPRPRREPPKAAAAGLAGEAAASALESDRPGPQTAGSVTSQPWDRTFRASASLFPRLGNGRKCSRCVIAGREGQWGGGGSRVLHELPHAAATCREHTVVTSGSHWCEGQGWGCKGDGPKPGPGLGRGPRRPPTSPHWELPPSQRDGSSLTLWTPALSARGTPPCSPGGEGLASAVPSPPRNRNCGSPAGRGHHHQPRGRAPGDGNQPHGGHRGPAE